MATIRNIASEANVSIATVSRVLNEGEGVSDDVRRRVQKVASKLGYSTGRRPSVGNLIALTYTGRNSLESPYDVAVLKAMSKAADGQNFDLAIINLAIDRRPAETAAQMLHRKGVRAAILRTSADTRQTCVELANDLFPHVVVGECFSEPAVNYVYADSKPTTYRAIEHLISLGHRRIAIAVSHVPDKDHADRLAAYEEAHADHGLAVDPKLIYRVWAMRSHGEQVIRNLMSLPDRPTAIFIADPLVAVGAINQAHQMRVRIPEDVSIIGFDDADTRRNVFPVLSAVCQDAYQLGAEAMLSLLRIIQNPSDAPIRKVLPTLLELHETTGRAPAEQYRFLPDGSRIDDGMNHIEPVPAEVPGGVA